jgi:tripartite-type tricarboxylate transporter receptor subunit TctC
MENHARIARIICAVVLMTASIVAAGQPYPTKAVRLIVPFTPAGITALLARGLAQELSKTWGQPVVVENRPGANTIIGAEAAAKSAPDGYTLFLSDPAGLVLNPYLYRRLPYDPVNDFAPIVNIASTSLLLTAAPSFPAGSLRDLVALAKQKPSEITYATLGMGSATHVPMEAFSADVGIKLTNVPYKGMAEVLQAMMTDQVSIGFAGVPPAIPLVRSGKLRAIAIAAPRRSEHLPDVPTFTELGFRFESGAWFGLVAPGRTPRAVIDKIAADAAQIIGSKEFREKYITGVGLEPLGQTPNEFAEYLRSERVKHAAWIKAAGVRLD